MFGSCKRWLCRRWGGEGGRGEGGRRRGGGGKEEGGGVSLTTANDHRLSLVNTISLDCLGKR